ncbi:hypothetical protein VNI00_006899 [Paramarasmius palmivorus]|uniref:Serine protease inhibitor n=1 Tax=Paramarasmius palmivorus TaxID=297713 RepID=A0AAW0D8B3_9AGAR
MSLESGLYIIRNIDKAVGRKQAEDRSLLPKRVVVLPPSVEDPKWEIQKEDSNRYILKVQGAPTANIDRLVFALLQDEESAEKWRIEAVPQHGENRYIITTQDQNEGWVAPEETDDQVKCQPLVATKSLPPQYLPTEVFEIVRAE